MKRRLAPILSSALLLALLLGLSAGAFAQTSPRVLLDTDRGPILIELDQANTPVTTANFLAYVDAGTFNNTLFQRVVRDFIVQGGGVKADGTSITRRPNIVSERNNANRLRNLRGTIAMALSATNGVYSHNSANSDFFFNARDNANLDPDFTAFGRIIFGMATLDAMNSTPVFTGTQDPIRYPLIKRAVRTSGFPILPLHTGAWFDPAKSGRGFNLEISNAAGGGQDPLLVVYWYDFHEGRQIWLSGVAPFSWGASQVTVPLLIANGGQFGSAYDPAQVTRNENWGQLIVRFEACDRARVFYTSEFGDGEIVLARLTIPTNETCVG